VETRRWDGPMRGAIIPSSRGETTQPVEADDTTERDPRSLAEMATQ